MTDINTVTVMGRTVREIGPNDFAYMANGTARLNFSVAVNESRKNGDQWEDYPNFIDITVWGKQAESCKTNFAKGKQVVITGRIHQDRWEKDGQKNARVLIIADVVRFVGPRDQNQQQPQHNQQPQYAGGFSEDIPF